jgi:hypothetical protein
MVDPEWIRHLAGARYGQDQWQLAEPEKVESLKIGRLKDALFELRDEAQASTSLHNQFAPRARAVTYLPTEARPPYGQGGLILMMGTLQVSLELLISNQHTPVLGALVTTLSTLHSDYTRSHKTLARYQAQTDTFGTLVWRRENTLIMTSELIIKSLLEELTKAAFKIEQLNQNRGVGR